METSHVRIRPGETSPDVIMADRPRRVKVFVLLHDEQWRTVGTGQISCSYIERLQGICVLVRSEFDGSLIVQSKIGPNVLYQKAQGDLISWSTSNNHSTALHFPDPEDCRAIWEAICRVQGKDPSVEMTQDFSNESRRLDDMPPLWDLLETPNCELGKLADLLSSVYASPTCNEFLARQFLSCNSIQSLLRMFRTCERRKNIQGLYCFHTIMKRILFINNTSLFRIMFSDEWLMDVVGCLEYDPALNEPKRHREFLMQNAKLKVIVPIAHPKLKQKIHKIYNVQYIHDILLQSPSVFAKNDLSRIENFIFCLKFELFTMLHNDKKFLHELLTQLRDYTIDNDKWRELLFFFKEICAFFQALQHQSKDALLKTLITLGILPTLKGLIIIDDYAVKVAGLAIFGHLVEYNAYVVQEYTMAEIVDCEDNELMLNKVIEQMAGDTDPHLGCATQVKEILCNILHPQNMDPRIYRCKMSEFLHFFYTHCMNNMIAPLLSATSANKKEHAIFEPAKEEGFSDNSQTAQLLELILELLTFCVQHHTFYIKYYILDKDLLQRTLVLINSKHTCLILCVVRLMRQIISLKDKLLIHYIIKKNLLEPLVNALTLDGTRYNMVNSAISEIFDLIRVENITSLKSHIGQKFSHALESTLLHSVGKDFPNHNDTVMKNKELKEIEFNVRSPKRTSSGGFRSSSAYPADNRTSRPHCSQTVSSVEYLEANNGGGGGPHEKEDEDNEGKAPPKKRPNLIS